MFELKKIINVDWQRSCFCGKPLIKGFCETHGSEIKTNSYIIHAQFEEMNSKKNSPINLSLTENQFLNLFPRKEIDDYFNNQIEYEVEIAQFGSNNEIKPVIEFFFEQMETDNFFNANRLKDVQITNSGITIHFLYSYKISSQNKLKIQFSALALRSLDNYIKWRLSNFQAKSDNIIKSLTGLRKNVYDESGQKYQIIKINWDLSMRSPKTIAVQNHQKTMEISPQKLYHGQENLLLLTKLENRIYSALKKFSQQFTSSLKQYLVAQSCLATMQKTNQFNISALNRFIGKSIKKTINLNDYVST